MPPRLIRASLALLLLASPVLAETAVPQSQMQMDLSFAPVVRSAAPAVVNIYTTRIVEDRQSPFVDDSFFSQFFRDFAPATPRVQHSLGSGVIVAADGLVVSNYHVVGDASEIRVVLNDRREFDAKVLLADKESDLAVLKLEDATGLQALPIRDSDELQVGDLVLAIGDPFGVGQTVSSGIVSGLARSMPSVGDGHGLFIQTDAAINPGNSGGALVDIQGRLVGINTAIISKTGGSLGIGFAIPSNLVKHFVEQAQSGAARFQRPWAGVAGQAVDDSMAEAMGLDRPEGVALISLHPDSPLAAAGLRAGDIVLSVGGVAVNSPEEMLFRLTTTGIGSTASVVYLHDAKQNTASIQLIAPPDTPSRDTRTITMNSPLRGLTVARINPAVADELGLPLDVEGVVAASVDDIAERAGLEQGDIIKAINGHEIATTSDVEQMAEDQTSRWRIDLLRSGQMMSLRFRL
ncbi:Do family serine endopeptidase [Tabrizicola sp. J26]|uniref:Do family serine endopeptidase n=1 Tax=Alitabrizicola rongguiensis TaxID=2909234 RepID=UPI001F3F9F99|nr:Do family serine endopeptidase [Tabrizicola rongguiensis]MCF1707964.1 Do family serine endopeptidase [Tabrizicola rongguiensis]